MNDTPIQLIWIHWKILQIRGYSNEMNLFRFNEFNSIQSWNVRFVVITLSSWVIFNLIDTFWHYLIPCTHLQNWRTIFHLEIYERQMIRKKLVVIRIIQLAIIIANVSLFLWRFPTENVSKTTLFLSHSIANIHQRIR